MAKELHENICDEKIFEGLYNKYASSLHDFLYYKYGESYSPRDKTQEAFIKLWHNCSQISLSKAKSYLFTVANNMMLNEVKHRKVVLRHQQQKIKTHTLETPEFELEKRQYYDKYQQALSKLTEDQRVAFLLNKVEGKKHAEIADMLNVTRKVVEYRIYSAFKILKEELEEFNIK